MNLRELHLFDLVVIPGAIDVSGGTSQKREQSFHVDEGWDLRELLPGVFSVSREDMPHAVTVGGVGYSYVPMPFDMAEQRKLEDAVNNVRTPDSDTMTDEECGYKPGPVVQQMHHRKGKR